MAGRQSILRGALAVLIGLGCLATFAPVHAQGNAAQLLARVAPTIVTIKAVLKTDMNMPMMGNQSEEQRVELSGVVVDPSGLVMLSNADISAERMKELLASTNPMFADMEITITPTEFKVTFGSEEIEHAAFLVAKDTKLDLAFLQVQGLEGPVAAVDFANGGTIAIGQTLLSVARLKKGYDYAPFFQTGQVSGELTKPRKAWCVDGSLGGYGLPVFDAQGQVLGALVTLAPSTTEASTGGNVSGLLRMLGGGGAAGGAIGTFLLPARVVNSAITQSRKKAEELKESGATTSPPPPAEVGGDDPEGGEG